MNFYAVSLVHAVRGMWDMSGQTIQFKSLSLTYLHSLGVLNVKFWCGKRTLWIKGIPDV